MNLREAAQQALEALEVWRDCLTDPRANPGWRFAVVGEKAMNTLRTALADTQDWDEIEALRESLREHMVEIHRLRAAGRQALEALEEYQQKGAPFMSCDAAVDALRAALAETTSQESRQVEPVAWMVYTLDGQSVFITDNAADFTQENRALPLYTDPPKREPLTKRKIVQVAGKQVAEKIVNGQDITPDDWIAFARAIEAAHGIKGEA